MSDYFQIIIYLIIIFAFLNSLFKKKDKEKTPPGTSNSPDRERQRSQVPQGYDQSRKQVEYDIMKEIEGLFKGEIDYPGRTKMESDIEKAEMRKVPDEEHTEDKEWHTEDSEWHTEDEEWHEQSKKEHQLDKSWHSITSYKKPVVDAAIEKEAERFERMLADRNKEVPYPFDDLRKKLYSPESLKEFIVFSEILGKPKYLRR